MMEPSPKRIRLEVVEEVGHTETLIATPEVAAARVFNDDNICLMILIQVSYEASERQHEQVEADMQHLDDVPEQSVIFDDEVPNPHREPHIVKRKLLEPLTTLAPLHRVSRTFNRALHRKVLQTQMFRTGIDNTLDPRDCVWWLLIQKIGGLQYCVRNYAGQAVWEDQNGNRHLAWYFSRERKQSVLFGVGSQCSDWLRSEHAMGDCTCGRYRGYRDRLGRQALIRELNAHLRQVTLAPEQHPSQVLFSRDYCPEHNSLLRFLADDKWSRSDASWRRVQLTGPSTESHIKIQLEVCYYPPSFISNDDGTRNELCAWDDYSCSYTCDEGATLGSLFEWWTTQINRAMALDDGHQESRVA